MTGVISRVLPAGFETLEPFVQDWALPTAGHRYQRRIDSTEAERSDFYAAGKDLVERGLALLDEKAMADFDAVETRLMLVLLSLAHVAQAVEVQKDHEAAHARLRRGLTISQASSDRGGFPGFKPLEAGQ